MADRGASAAFLAELLKSTSAPCWLVDAYFDDGTISLTDAWRPITWGGRTYTANGHFLSFSGLTETAELQVPQLTLTLSAVDQVWISIALTKNYVDRRLVISRAFIDYTTAAVTPIASPVSFEYRMDGMNIADDPNGECTVAVTASSHFGDFERRAGRHTNSSEHQVFFPGDLFFDYASNLNREIRWGAPQ